MLKPRLLFVVNGARFFLSHRLNIALQAKAEGWDVHVATPYDEDAIGIERAGLHYHEIALCRSGSNPFKEVRSIIQLAGLLRSVRPDLIHAVTIKPVLYSGILARLMRVKCLVMAVSGLGHVFTCEGHGARLRRFAVNAMYRIAFGHRNARVIFQNPDDMQMLSSCLRATPAVLIPGAGVNPDVYYPTPVPHGTPIVILAGRLLWNKGVGIFVDAAKCLHAKGVKARFVIVGEPDPGNPDSVGQDDLEAWQAAGCIEWWGRRNDMPCVLEGATVVCLPTFYGEGVPKILIEAAMVGRPIIATNWPGCREIVEHGHNGLLVEPRDVAAFAKALKELLDDPQRCQEMGAAGRKKALSGFSDREVVTRTFDVYRELMPVS